MGQLFGRSYKLIVAPSESATGLDVSDLAFAFTAKRTLKPEPNTLDLKIYNLSDDSRSFLSSSKKNIVKLEAGYGEELSQIYLGEVRNVCSYQDGPDVVTMLSSGDGEKAIRTANLKVSYGPKTPATTVLRAIVKTLGIKDGNFGEAAALLAKKGIATLHPSSVTLSGNAAQEMTDFCRSAGLEWSIQNGALQILDLNTPLNEQAFELSSETGMVGSPMVDNKGVVQVKTLMIPEIRPGVKLSFNAKYLKGGYRVTQCEYSGDTYGDDWYINITAKKY